VTAAPAPAAAGSRAAAAIAAPAAPAGPPAAFFDRRRLVLTPEHVELRLVPAGLASRFLAASTDGFIVLSATTLIDLLLSLLPFGIGRAVAITLGFALTWTYHLYFEVRHQGRTPGKRLLGLRVVDGRGLPITWQQSLVRNAVRALDFLPAFYGLGGLVCLLDRDRRRLGDVLADTLVVREARAAPVTAAALGRPRRFNSLRTRRVLRLIRHRIGLEEREFLLALCLRAEALEEQARYDLMEEVAARYREKLGIDDPHLSGENLVRDLTAILFSDEGRVGGAAAK
jgi:uncharacterized RDD family membrane protein YckC